jgi:hypothetical protein
MGDLQLFEKLVGGTVGGAAVLAFVAWQLWKRMQDQDVRMVQKDTHIITLTEKFILAVSDLRETVKDNTDAVTGLREAIDRAESPQRRRAAGAD